MPTSAHVERGLAVITLDYPPLNILTWEARNEITEAVSSMSARGDVRALLLLSAAPRAFSVGTDINEFLGVVASAGGADRSRREHEMYGRIEFQAKPAICAVNGYCLGGGLELALAFDIRLASASAVFGLPEIDLACFPGGGGTERLALAVGRARAKEIMWTGERFTAAQALSWGLVNHVVPDADLAETATHLGRKIASQAPDPVRHIKYLVDAIDDVPERMQRAAPRVAPLIGSALASDTVRERAEQFIGRR